MHHDDREVSALGPVTDPLVSIPIPRQHRSSAGCFSYPPYRTAPQSGAFPGWTAEAIHTALNEPALSAATGRDLDRVGRALGARDGTGPEDTPWLRAYHEEGRNRGRIDGRTEARIEGRTEGRAEIVDAFRRKLVASRGISGVSDEEIIDALLECEDQRDFWARLESPRR